MAKEDKKDVNDYGLNERQMQFCEYYVKNGSAGLSYQKAYDPDGSRGLKMGSCYSNGHRLLKSEKINNYLNILRSQIKTERVLSAEDILGELTEIAQDFGTKTSDKLRALELLGKHLALWQDKVNVSNDMVIEVNLTGMEDELKIIEVEQEKIEEKKVGNE